MSYSSRAFLEAREFEELNPEYKETRNGAMFQRQSLDQHWREYLEKYPDAKEREEAFRQTRKARDCEF